MLRAYEARVIILADAVREWAPPDAVASAGGAMIDLCLLATIPIFALLIAWGVIDPERGLLLMLPCGGILLILALMRRLTRYDGSPPWKT